MSDFLSFPQVLSGNPDAVPVKTGIQNRKTLDSPIKSGNDRLTTNLPAGRRLDS